MGAVGPRIQRDLSPAPCNSSGVSWCPVWMWTQREYDYLVSELPPRLAVSCTPTAWTIVARHCSAAVWTIAACHLGLRTTLILPTAWLFMVLPTRPFTLAFSACVSSALAFHADSSFCTDREAPSRSGLDSKRSSHFSTSVRRGQLTKQHYCT